MIFEDLKICFSCLNALGFLWNSRFFFLYFSYKFYYNNIYKYYKFSLLFLHTPSPICEYDGITITITVGSRSPDRVRVFVFTISNVIIQSS